MHRDLGRIAPILPRQVQLNKEKRRTLPQTGAMPTGTVGMQCGDEKQNMPTLRVGMAPIVGIGYRLRRINANPPNASRLIVAGSGMLFAGEM